MGKIKDFFKNLVGKKNSTRAESKGKTGQKYNLSLEMVCNKQYSLAKDIRRCPLSRKDVKEADTIARDFIEETLKTQSANNVLPGQLVSFNYFEPKTKEDLEYYDAMPVTIFFGVVNTKQGKRILGFNIHYYPPKIRRSIMSSIFKMYRPVYAKYFTENLNKEVDAFDYRYIIDELDKVGLSFGVRMYIPSLCHKVRQLPPNMWKVAVYTEGRFKKRTREQIMKFWERYKDTH
jgi:hypothetical protein